MNPAMVEFMWTSLLKCQPYHTWCAGKGNYILLYKTLILVNAGFKGSDRNVVSLVFGELKRFYSNKRGKDS